MTARSFPLVAILPDLWTVAHRSRPISQHATLALAVAHIRALVESDAGSESDYTLVQPEHSQSAIQLARVAITKAQATSRSKQ